MCSRSRDRCGRHPRTRVCRPHPHPRSRACAARIRVHARVPAVSGMHAPVPAARHAPHSARAGVPRVRRGHRPLPGHRTGAGRPRQHTAAPASDSRLRTPRPCTRRCLPSSGPSPRRCRPRPRCFFAVLQEDRWPPGPDHDPGALGPGRHANPARARTTPPAHSGPGRHPGATRTRTATPMQTRARTTARAHSPHPRPGASARPRPGASARPPARCLRAPRPGPSSRPGHSGIRAFGHSDTRARAAVSARSRRGRRLRAPWVRPSATGDLAWSHA